MSVNLPATGRCQCGNIRYELVAEPIVTICCHCSDCQKLSASSFSMTMLLNRSALRIVEGEMKSWERKAESGNRVICWFCPTCGNRIFHENPDAPETIRFKPGTLDDTSALNPSAHIWTSREQHWHTRCHDLPRAEHQPDLAMALKNIAEGRPPF
jgi:hypothetical protein